MSELVLTGIAVYPLKSGAPVDVDARAVEPCGLRGDRCWMVIDGDGVCVTARERSQMVRIRAGIAGPALRLEMDGREPLTVSYPDAGSPVAPVWIWGQACNARDAGDAAARWMSAAIDKPVRLVAMDNRAKRRPRSGLHATRRRSELRRLLPGAGDWPELPRRLEHPHSGPGVDAPVPAQFRDRRGCAVRGRRLAAHSHRFGGIRRRGELRTVRAADRRPGHRHPGFDARADAHPRPLSSPRHRRGVPGPRTWCREAPAPFGSATASWCWKPRIEVRTHDSDVTVPPICHGCAQGA